MVERGANIDIVFRNGLKDLEVLPPPEVWENVQPIIKRKNIPLILLRRAALIAVMLTMSFLTSRWGGEISTGFDSALMALNEDSVSPQSSSELVTPLAIASEGDSIIMITPEILVDSVQDLPSVTVNDNNTSANIAFIQETNSLSINDNSILNEQQMVNLKSSFKNTYISGEFADPFLPVTENEKVTERWSIAAMASPTYYSSFNSGNDELSKQLDASEQSMISYSGGVALSYKVNKRLSVQSGLFYSSVGQEVGGINSFGGFRKYDNAKNDR